MGFGELCNVRRVFDGPKVRGKREPLVAVDDVSLSFEQGELVSFLGPSGCGKTTLLKIMAGLIPKTSGSVRIRGIEVDEPQRDFGFVFQSPNLMPWRTVLDNVLFPMEIMRQCDRHAVARAHELLAIVGLEGFHRSRPHQLSGGMQQRVALCRALIHQPSLLLMDEPFGALDELTRMEMNDLLSAIRARSKATVVFVTHSIAEAVYLSDQVLVFSKRPARIAERFIVDIPYPRTMETRYSDPFTRFEERAGRALGVLRTPGNVLA